MKKNQQRKKSIQEAPGNRSGHISTDSSLDVTDQTMSHFFCLSVSSGAEIDYTKMRHSYIVFSFNAKKMKFNDTGLCIIYVSASWLPLKKNSL